MSRPDLSTGVLLLAHRRLTSLAHALRTKNSLDDVEIDTEHNRGPVAKRDVEARVRALADAALAMLEYADPIPPPATARLGFGVSRAAVTGTIGTTLPLIAARNAADRAWYREAIHRGSADPDLSRIAVPSAELALDVGARALARAASDPERAKIRALTLGMLADVATHVIVGPVLRGAAADTSFVDPDLATTPAAVAAAGFTADRLLGGRAGRSWADWWLSTAEVPPAFFRGYAEAVAALDAVATPLGFHARLDSSPRGSPLTTEQLTTAYRLFLDGLSNPFTISHAGIPPIGARLGLVQWWLLMVPVFLGPPIALLLSEATPRSRLLWEPPSSLTPPDASSWMELAALGDLSGSVMPLIYPVLMWSGYPGASYPFAEAIAFAAWRILFGTLGLTRGTDENARTAMLLLQVLPDAIALVQMIVELILGHRGPALIMMIQLASALSMALSLLAGAAFRGLGVTWSWSSFLPGWLIVLVICLGLAFAAGAVIHGQGGFRLIVDNPSTTTGVAVTPPLIGSLPTASPPEPRASAMVFGDASLFRIPGVGGGSPTRAHYAYPSGNRDLLKLSWAGRTPLTLRIDGARLSFQIQSDPAIVVVAPPGSTAQTLADLLVDRVRDGGAQKLTVAQAAASELQPALAFPATLSDPGDDRATLADREAHRNDPITISTDAAHPTVLRHAPRSHAGIRFGVAGPARTSLEGWKIVPSELLGDTDVTAMGAAADLAALLFLGAAPDLAASPIAAPGGPLRPVYEVFRRWNLDERSANEWRALIAGGARSDRAGTGDPLRRPSPVGATVADDPDGRALLERAGWIPTWRAWMRVAADPTQDTTAPRAAAYSPPDGAAPTTQAPTNDLLSRAVRVLLNV